MYMSYFVLTCLAIDASMISFDAVSAHTTTHIGSFKASLITEKNTSRKFSTGAFRLKEISVFLYHILHQGLLVVYYF